MTINDNKSNESGSSNFDFIAENPGIAIPYLTFLSLFTLNGCIRNFMFSAAVVSYKVNTHHNGQMEGKYFYVELEDQFLVFVYGGIFGSHFGNKNIAILSHTMVWFYE